MFQNGYLSALPYLVIFILIFPISWSADKLVNEGVITYHVQRKLYNTIGCFGAALGLIMLSLVKCDVAMAVASLCMIMGFLAWNIPGCFVSYVTYRVFQKSILFAISLNPFVANDITKTNV
jgi:ACS family sodium-dependent inorganic phosphate cotransporter-like MFS transporter 5